MSFEKKVCILKQCKKGFSADGNELAGAVYAERLGDTVTVTVRAAGLAPLKEGNYVLSLAIGKERYALPYQSSVRLQAPPLKEGFAALLSYRGEAVFYGKTGNAPGAEDLLQELAKKGAPVSVPPDAQTAPSDPPEKEKEEARRTEAPFCAYDDEAIADGDYFEADENGDPSHPPRTGHEKETDGTGADGDEKDAFAYPRGTLAYYLSVKEQLDTAFRKFPKDERLTPIFPHSQWADGGSGLLGIIYEAGQPKFLCVATPAGGKLPDEMKEHGVFVPTLFSDDEGFYIVFQDADTGAYVRVETT